MQVIRNKGIALFPAFELCGSSLYGKTDWFLPTYNDILSVNQSLILSVIAASPSKSIWTSSRASGNQSWAMRQGMIAESPNSNLARSIVCMRFLN